MSDPIEEHQDERPNVVGTDPDLNIGDDDPAAASREEDDEEDDDRVDVEDLP